MFTPSGKRHWAPFPGNKDLSVWHLFHRWYTLLRGRVEVTAPFSLKVRRVSSCCIYVSGCVRHQVLKGSSASKSPRLLRVSQVIYTVYGLFFVNQAMLNLSRNCCRLKCVVFHNEIPQRRSQPPPLLPHSGPGTGEGGRNSGHVTTPRVVK